MKPSLSLLFALFFVIPAIGGICTVHAQSDRTFKTITTTADGNGRRTALVVGNATYQYAKSLPNPINDASAMSSTLTELGFEVKAVTNVTRTALKDAINQWGATLKNYEVGLFYYAGHAIEVDGINYLCPTNAHPLNKSQVEDETVTIRLITGWMKEANIKTNIVLLDACRDNPYRSFRSGGDDGGLASMSAPSGTFIGFAATPGMKASDGPRANGLYTEAILRTIKTPNLTIDQVFNQVNAYVRRESGGEQVPFKNSSLEADFYFRISKSQKPEPYTPPKDLPVGPAMAFVRGGVFDMGSTEGEADEKPVHTVTVSSFSMAKYETTVAEFAQFVAETNYRTDAEKLGSSSLWSPLKETSYDSTGINWRYGADGVRLSAANYNHPVVHVSYNDAVAYCEWLSKKTGRTYRLPTEAQWEYAAGNGVKHTKYSWGNNSPVDQVANVADESFKSTFYNKNWIIFTGYNDKYAYTAPVGSYKANEFDLHDMIGNVFEWCSDWYGSDYYTNSSISNPVGPATGSLRVIRGGSWSYNPANSRVAYRLNETPSYRYGNVGFRVVSLQ